MSGFQVTPEQLAEVIRSLSEKNGQFRARLAELETAREELSSCWKGESEIVFNRVFDQNRTQWNEFSGLIDQYIFALDRVRSIYLNTEETNRRIAAQRA